ncbi:STAS domain-containing protein [Streptomyces sp. BK239]|uniref:STAS domain-containing protein n=1 Tax=Streptomyces sp. BK239 TaxID=2512155 RepID=UPI0010D33261|nr:STAS domain-containing protein [Streptomyces sp. BK239]RZU23874.1 anti-anti-sigma factor [Streptomyces sp. BK239]
MSRSTVDGVDVVSPRGEIDHDTGRLFRAALEATDGWGGGRMVVDLSEVTFMDSTGVNVLVTAHHAALAGGGRLRLAVPRGPVLRVLELVGLDGVIAICPTVEEALAD